MNNIIKTNNLGSVELFKKAISTSKNDLIQSTSGREVLEVPNSEIVEKKKYWCESRGKNCEFNPETCSMA